MLGTKPFHCDMKVAGRPLAGHVEDSGKGRVCEPAHLFL